MLSAAENLAARTLVRQALVAPVRKARQEQAAPNADAVQTLSGLSFVMIVDAGRDRSRRHRGTRPGSASPCPSGRAPPIAGAPGSATAPTTVPARWSPTYPSSAGGREQAVIGMAVVGQEYPTVVANLLSAVPNLLTYLGLSAAAGIAGSLLLARRVKRQTLGLEPLEIRGLVEHREAMLTGIKEGVLALDPQDRVALVNAEAHRMLRLPPRLRREVADRDRRRGPPARRAHRPRRRPGRGGLRR